MEKIENQGENDSFFAGEEYIDQESHNPNVDMGFSKFRFEPSPDFVIQNCTNLQDVIDMANDTDRGSQNASKRSQDSKNISKKSTSRAGSARGEGRDSARSGNTSARKHKKKKS